MNFVTEEDWKSGELDDEEDDEDVGVKSMINSYTEALRWATVLKLFAADKGLDSVVYDISAEAQLEQSFLY